MLQKVSNIVIVNQVAIGMHTTVVDGAPFVNYYPLGSTLLIQTPQLENSTE